MPSQSEIAKGAFAVLSGIAGIPDISYPNIDYTTANEYVAVEVLGVESEAATVGCDDLMGIIQASVYVRDGIGVIVPLDYVDLIVAAFPKGLEVTNGGTKFRVTKTGWPAPRLIDKQGWIQYPVSIPIKTFN